MNIHLKLLRQLNLSHKSRFLTTISTKSRTLLLRNVQSSNILNEVLEWNHAGPIEHIQYDSKSSRAFLSFLDQNTAEKFFNKVQNSKHNVDPIFFTGVQRQVKVEVVAVIGLRGASRCITVKLPQGATQESFKQEMSQFGEIHKVAVTTKKNNIKNDRRFGTMYTTGKVHFYSIESALRALNTINKEQDARANFKIEECDSPLSRMYHDFNKAGLVRRQRPEQLRSVYLQKYEGFDGPIHRQLVSLIQKASLVSRGEVIQSIEKKNQENGLVVTFIRAEDALLFWNACNSEGRASGFTNATLTVTPPETAIFHIARAVSMGATRTLGIHNIKGRLSTKDIYSDFRRFGALYEVRFSENRNSAFVKFGYISSSLRVIDQISTNNGVFKEAYSGAAVNFAADVALGNPPSSLQHLYIRSADD